MKEMDTILIKIPSQIKKELQIIAISENTNMTKIITELIQNYINQYNNK